MRILIFFSLVVLNFDRSGLIGLNSAFGNQSGFNLLAEELNFRNPIRFPWDAKYYLWVSEDESSKIYMAIDAEEIQKRIWYDFRFSEGLQADETDNNQSGVKRYSCLVNRVYAQFSCGSAEGFQQNPITVWAERAPGANGEVLIFVQGLNASGGTSKDVRSFRKYR